MNDAVRPREDVFNRTLRDSCQIWSAYLATDSSKLPFQCVELKNVLARTPHFLADGNAISYELRSFDCIERGCSPGPYDFFVKGYSKWKTSKGSCDLPHRILDHKLLLATQATLKVEFSDETAFTDWPNVETLDGYDQGNYISILVLAWAYILSAKWAELLQRSSGYDCFKKNIFSTSLSHTKSFKNAIEIDGDIDEQEVCWWNAILAGDRGWQVGVHYNKKTYMSPWSISVLEENCEKGIPGTQFAPSSSDIALGYLATFCTRHRLYGQCSAALAAALYIPLLSGRRTRLPTPKPAPSHATINQSSTIRSPAGISSTELISNYGALLPHFMSLSTNTWGMRSNLCGAFFNPDIPCNLVSAWLNPAFAIIDPLLKESNMEKLAGVLSRRQPRLASLWLGAIIMGVAKSELRDLKNGLSALDLHAAAWTGYVQSFITLGLGNHEGQLIRREDECRLLFIIAADDRYRRPPISPWKPFGRTHVRDTELEVQQHVQCNCHCFEYEAWHWRLADGREFLDYGIDQFFTDEATYNNKTSTLSCSLLNNDLSSQSLSEGATRGIFEWLRSTGYPACIKPIYQHPWIDIGSSDDESSDYKSDIDTPAKTKMENTDIWLKTIHV